MFAVIIIGVLAMISAALILTVGQSSKLSSNVVGKIENDFAARSGLDHATARLRDSVTSHMIYTDIGVFCPTDPVTGVFDPNSPPGTHPWMKLNKPKVPLAVADYFNPLESTAPYISPWTQFRDEDEEALSITDAIPLSIVTPVPLTSSLYYSSSPIYTSGNPVNRALLNDLQGSMTDFYKQTDNFYKDKVKWKPKDRPLNTRGGYWVWISDLDSKLYAHPRDEFEPFQTRIAKHGWDLDTYRTGEIPAQPGAPSPPLLGTPSIDTILESILKFTDGSFQLLPELESYAANDGSPLTLREQMLEEVWNLEIAALPGGDNRMRHFTSMDEATTQLPSIHFLPGPSPTPEELQDPANLRPEYSQARAEFGVYFTPYRDVTTLNSGIAQKFVKDHATAININTASIEVIAAAISQVPAQNDLLSPEVHDPMTPERCIFLARRIVAKRPFICRMDFEDFLAAHLMGSNLLDTDPGSLTVPPDSDIWNDPSYVRTIFYSMQRRWGNGYTPADSTVTPTSPTNIAQEDIVFFQNPELSLAQYLEVPVLDDSATARANPDSEISRLLNLYKITVDGFVTYPNEPRYQIARFKFFFNDEQGTDVVSAPRANCLITPFEFNNLINSVTSIFPNDDKQEQDVGGISVAIPVVTAGPDGALQTSPQGDDTFVKRIYPGPDGVLQSARPPTSDDLLDGGTIIAGADGIFQTAVAGDDEMKLDTSAIWPGPNGVAETWVSALRPSYYSYIQDELFAANFWDGSTASIDSALRDRVNSAPTPPPTFFTATHLLSNDLRTIVLGPTTETILEADRRAARSMRLYYRLPLDMGDQTPQTGWPNGRPPLPGTAEMQHLVSWRCLPSATPPPVAPPVPFARRSGFYQISFDDWSLVYGPFQVMGDYQWYNDVSGFTVDDPDFDDLLYSSARPWSGAIIAGYNFDANHDGLIDPAELEDKVGNGDVSWGPKFAYRSRFFGIHVLGQGAIAAPMPDPNDTSPKATNQRAAVEARLKSQGEKRVEAVYDALLDQIIWQRSPITDKRALGEPAP